jgi:hypothetical protein
MNKQRMKDLRENPDWIKDSEVRMLVIQYELHQELLMLRNQQLRLLKANMLDLIERTTALVTQPSEGWWDRAFRRTS